MSLLLTLLFSELLVRLIWPGESQAPPANGIAVRADDFRQPPPGPKEGKLRILAFGDSYTWGHGVADGKLVWPALLEEFVAGAAGSRRIEVINLGVPGFTTVNELELLSRVGIGLEPDIIIVQYLINDVLPSGLNYWRVGEEWLDGRRVLPLLPSRRLHRALLAHSAFYRLADRRFASLQRRIWPPRRWNDLYIENFAGWRDMRKAIAAIARVASDRGIPAVFMIFPSLHSGHWSDATHPETAINAMVETYAREQGLLTLELLPAFARAGRSFEEWWVSPTDPHPNPEAHALVAQTLGEFLIERGLLAPRAAGAPAVHEDRTRPGVPSK